MIQGIGNDIVEIVRIQQMDLAKLSARILTERERLQLPEQLKRKSEFLAGRFAAKEAISKALGTGIGAHFSFYDVEIIPDQNGKPEVHISSRLMKQLNDDHGQIRFHLSISHSDQYATAICVMEQLA